MELIPVVAVVVILAVQGSWLASAGKQQLHSFTAFMFTLKSYLEKYI